VYNAQGSGIGARVANRLLTDQQLRDRLRQAVEAEGGIRAYARNRSVQASEVSRALNVGSKKPIGTAVAATLGLTPVVLWANVSSDQTEAA